MESRGPDARGAKPDWLRVRLPSGPDAAALGRRLRRLRLNTVCEEARCPNLGECWGRGTATVMILGDTCTRNCRFCAVSTGDPGGALDPGEPGRVATAVAEAGLGYVVLTSVDRDDLPDGGAGRFADTIRAVRRAAPGTRIEALIPDYCGGELAAVTEAGPDVLAHNVEVVRRLTPVVRDRRASWDRSLATLKEARALAPAIPTKSSLLVGLGETRGELGEALRELRAAGVAMVTLGQYLRPTAWHAEVVRYVTPPEFAEIESEARGMGFEFVASGPLVRSSYRAEELAARGGLTCGGA
jgi:lipoic acid synthetase